MKKLLLSIGLCLGLLGLNTNIYAQTTPSTAVENSVGSIHGFKVNFDGTDHTHIGNYYEWSVFEVNASSIYGAADFEGVAVNKLKFNFFDYDPVTKTFSNEADIDVYKGSNKHAVGIQWLDVTETGKVFAVEVKEYNGASGTCSSRRRFYVSVNNGDIDLIVEALDTDKSTLLDQTDVVALTDCNGNIGGLIDNDNPTLFGFTTRYFKITMKTSSELNWNGAWGFNYEVVNEANVTTPSVAVEGGATVATVTSDKIEVKESNASIIVAVTVPNNLGASPAANILMNFKAIDKDGTETTAYIVSNGNKFEVIGNNNDNKLENSVVISASPATTAISID